MELNEKLIFGTVLRSTDESDEYGICRKCARFKTDVCPNAARCFSTLHSNRQISRRMDTHGIIVVERFATFHYY